MATKTTISRRENERRRLQRIELCKSIIALTISENGYIDPAAQLAEVRELIIREYTMDLMREDRNV